MRIELTYRCGHVFRLQDFTGRDRATIKREAAQRRCPACDPRTRSCARRLQRGKYSPMAPTLS